jgi:putative ABC transport system permease protein
MRAAGVLRRAHAPDDLAVFVDLRTAWIIGGLGHGHQDLATVEDQDVLLKAEGNEYTANAKLLQYNEITEANLDSFHFHGDTSRFPISAIIAVPNDTKSADLLRGRFLSADETCQILRPVDVIRDLTGTLFRIEGILQSVFGMLGFATVLLVALVIMLSLRLRQREMQTMFKLGCSRSMIAGLVTAELGIIVAASGAFTLCLTMITGRYVDNILRGLVL